MQGSEKKIVYVKFLEAETYRENGRHVFAVLNPFLLAGYRVCLDDTVRRRLAELFGDSVADWPPPARLAMSLPGLEIVASPPPEAESGLYIFDRKDSGLGTRSWRQCLRIRFDLFSPFHFSKPVLLPYNVHPMHATRVTGESLHALRNLPRRIRVLFAGDMQGYKRRWIKHPKEKLSRIDVISTVKARLGENLELAMTGDDLERLLDSSYIGKFVLVDNDGARVPWDRWMDVIARADFFLCPPGIVMPMSHNLIEAMAIGTIPITSYPEWLSPRLEHMKNCIVFDNEDDLIEKIHLALEMSEAQKAGLRDNAVKYYEQHLRPETFVRKIEARDDTLLDVLMYSEYNVAKNPKKLNRRSVLMRGENAVGRWASLAGLWR